jgi:hypothetical protein
MEDVETIIADVIQNPKDPNLLGFKNISNHTWKVSLPDGSQRAVEPGRIVPVKDKFQIDFLGNNYVTTIEL